jgi:hypothetical protein
LLVKSDLVLVVVIVGHEFVVLLLLLVDAFFVVFAHCAVEIFYFSETLFEFVDFCVIVLDLCIFVRQLS